MAKAGREVAPHHGRGLPQPKMKAPQGAPPGTRMVAPDAEGETIGQKSAAPRLTSSETLPERSPRRERARARAR